MYQAIIVLDETRNKSYYYSYVAADGNIECEELPPYADVDKARACYWDAKSKKWIYDADKHAEIVEAQEAARAAEEQAEKEEAAVPSNKELAEAVVELAEGVADIEAAITELAGIVVGGGEA